MHIYVAEQAQFLGVFFSRECNKLLEGLFRAEPEGHLSQSCGIHVRKVLRKRGRNQSIASKSTVQTEQGHLIPIIKLV